MVSSFSVYSFDVKVSAEGAAALLVINLDIGNLSLDKLHYAVAVLSRALKLFLTKNILLALTVADIDKLVKQKVKLKGLIYWNSK